MEISEKNIYTFIFIMTLVFICFIPNISEIFTRDGAILDYLVPYFSHFITLLTIGILISCLCIKKILK